MSLFTFLEITATISGIICVFLQTRERIEAWAFGILSVGISAWIFYHSRLYSDLVLHIIYIFLNIFGWYNWSRKSTDTAPSPILQLSKKDFLAYAGLILGMTAVIGWLMEKYTDADLSYFDAFTTSGSLVAQFLLAKKFLENWLVWIVVDLVAIPVYLYKGLYYFSFLFFVYLIICIYGYLSWRRELKVRLTIQATVKPNI
ncbi:MAG: nicotinamide mononucleotide transporter [Bacteroidetes bacterium]|nr:nicotinamide mononucleotide transporter [Bacteroidota bacterium]